jgi:phosphoglycolate phosphatase
VLIFDLDGTLVDSFADIRAGLSEALTAIGLGPGGEILALCRRGVGLEWVYERATGRDPVGDEFDRFVAAYRGAYQPRGAPFPGVRDTLEELRRRLPGTCFAVATAKRTDIARRVVEATGLAACFDVIRGSEGLPHKPDPAVLHEIAARAGKPITGAVVVGDTDRDILAARAAGCAAIAVTYGGWSRAEMLEVGPDHLIDRFEELLELEPIARLGAPPRGL